MKKLILFSLLITAMYSCNSAGDGTKYKLAGVIKNGGGKNVVLEKLNLKQVTVIDSTTTDKDGRFNLSSTTEKGYYRLKIDNMHAWLILLENKNYQADLNYDNPGDYKITGGVANDEFQEATKVIQQAQLKIQTLNASFQQLQNQGASNDTLSKYSLQIQAEGEKLEKLMKDKATAAKDPLVALYYTSFLRMDKYPDENKKVVARLEKELPNASYTREMKEQITTLEQQLLVQQQAQNAEKNTAIGAKATDLAFKSPDGKVLKLSDLKGKVVLLDFWASWCGPCRRENPSVVAAYNRFKDKGFTIYSVSLDQDAAKWKSAIEQDGLVWPYHVSDLKGWGSDAARMYGVQGIPAQFLLDKNGVIIAKNLRGEQLDQKLAELLK